MITLQKLKKDEEEAIANYSKFLQQGGLTARENSLISQILLQEQIHLKELQEMTSLRRGK